LVHTVHIGAKWIWLGHCLLWSISWRNPRWV
jgi:hypothetical protein